MMARTHTSDKEEWARNPRATSQNLTPLANLTDRQQGWGCEFPSTLGNKLGRQDPNRAARDGPNPLAVE